MCGIFGISSNIDPVKDYDNIFSDIEKFVTLSELRGSDTFGISFKLKKNSILYKISEKPSIAIKRKNFKDFFNRNLKRTYQII